MSTRAGRLKVGRAVILEHLDALFLLSNNLKEKQRRQCGPERHHHILQINDKESLLKMDSWWHKSVTPSLYDSPTLFDRKRSFKTNGSINKKYINMIHIRVALEIRLYVHNCSVVTVEVKGMD